MPARLLHLSDLHVGTVEEPKVERALGALIERVGPELIVASGDLTHRARPAEHDRAAAFLKRLERPLLVVLVSVTAIGLLLGGVYVLLAVPIAAVLVTLVDVIVRDKDPADEEVPALLFPAKDAEA